MVLLSPIIATLTYVYEELRRIFFVRQRKGTSALWINRRARIPVFESSLTEQLHIFNESRQALFIDLLLLFEVGRF